MLYTGAHGGIFKGRVALNGIFEKGSNCADLFPNTLCKNPGEGGGGHLVLTLPGCVCRKVKDMGPFTASRE